jgi:formate dehydrogenase beta subunit
MPELLFVPASVDPDLTVAGKSGSDTTSSLKWEALPPYKQPAYHQQIGLMADGDVLTDFSAAIKAIAAGRRAAASIHRSLYNIGLGLPDTTVTPETPVQNVSKVSQVNTSARQIMPIANNSQVAKGMELEQGFDTTTAQTEANRCLQCGLICYLHDSGEMQAAEDQILVVNS